MPQYKFQILFIAGLYIIYKSQIIQLRNSDEVNFIFLFLHSAEMDWKNEISTEDTNSLYVDGVKQLQLNSLCMFDFINW